MFQEFHSHSKPRFHHRYASQRKRKSIAKWVKIFWWLVARLAKLIRWLFFRIALHSLTKFARRYSFRITNGWEAARSQQYPLKVVRIGKATYKNVSSFPCSLFVWRWKRERESESVRVRVWWIGIVVTKYNISLYRPRPHRRKTANWLASYSRAIVPFNSSKLKKSCGDL